MRIGKTPIAGSYRARALCASFHHQTEVSLLGLQSRISGARSQAKAPPQNYRMMASDDISADLSMRYAAMLRAAKRRIRRARAVYLEHLRVVSNNRENLAVPHGEIAGEI